ncbi:response regulator transcription factor [Corynebacterium aurimucosum]|uniref:Response regulator transcription factor n=2 Tax=Corynebacterium TaxID=1716 RepID=A0ABU9UFX7_9CORY|nr:MULTISPECIES: response regulator transcription factor [Corynebacterium]MBE7340193.1 response regulator transcription factor [Corynebacterium aurimucosum]MCL8493075.1 response regulator transcription factor [Corynebacterium intestinale]MCP1389307.1 response regulator transcription factor [Corynebacterium intestinale]MCZ9297909.1 response regulator transcription factor [Corynebacterium hesseae]MDK6807250.1 response regulator transcription factor [Corynebacterium aurimucosum]
MTNAIRVLIAEDQSLVRGALTALLNTEPDIEVVAGCGSGTEVAELVAKHSVDVALLDIEMPGMNGIDAAKSIAGTDCRSLIVTTFGRSGYVKRALEAGIDGFLVKDTPPDELADAIRRVHSGLRVIDPQLAQDILFAPDNPLSEREIEVCRLLVRGLGSADIASQLHLSGGTVRNHVSAIMAKTRAGNRFEAARRAEANGWI